MTSLSIYIEASFWPNWDGAWHQTMVRDTALTPTHIPMFYFFFPLSVVLALGAYLYGRFRIPAVYGRDKGFPVVLLSADLGRGARIRGGRLQRMGPQPLDVRGILLRARSTGRSSPMDGWRAECSRCGARPFCVCSRLKRRRAQRRNSRRIRLPPAKRSQRSRILTSDLRSREREAWRQHLDSHGAAAERQRRLELRDLLNAKYQWIDRTWDAVFWITAIFIVAGAADITKLLFAGDWDFWTDWKDPQWWPVVTAFATIIIPSALQYIQWAAWRFPTGATYTCVCLFMASWIGRYFQWHVAESYPMNFVWPISTVPAAIILDWLLMRTKSFVLTSLFGGPIWAVMVWGFNYIPLAPFLQPAAVHASHSHGRRRSGHRLYPLRRRPNTCGTSNAVRCAAFSARRSTSRCCSAARWRCSVIGSASSSGATSPCGRSADTSRPSERIAVRLQCVSHSLLARRHGRAFVDRPSLPPARMRTVESPDPTSLARR